MSHHIQVVITPGPPVPTVAPDPPNLSKRNQDTVTWISAYPNWQVDFGYNTPFLKDNGVDDDSVFNASHPTTGKIKAAAAGYFKYTVMAVGINDPGVIVEA